MMHVTMAAPLSLVFSPLVFWPYFAAAALTLIGVFAVRRELTEATGLDKILALGGAFVAASLAAFSSEHFGLAKFIQQGVPSWIPWHLFWAYFVGCALLAAALSIATNVQVRLSATLLGIMIFFFVLSIHLPKVLANPHDRIAWAVLVRDSSFAAGAWALAGSHTEEWRAHSTHKLITLGHLLIAVAAVFFGVEHFLHPQFVPVVPLGKLMPTWYPGHFLVAYVAGAVLVAAGVSLLVGIRTRAAATSIGILALAAVLLVYLPIAVAIPSAAGTGDKIEGLNYFFDTLLFAGMVLVLANALPKAERAR
jgi:uncharacterized membrane protein